MQMYTYRFLCVCVCMYLEAAHGIVLLEEDKGEEGMGFGDERIWGSRVFDRAVTDLAPAITANLHAEAISLSLS